MWIGKSKPKLVEFTAKYIRTNTVNNTVRRQAETAIRLSRLFITALSKVKNSEHYDLCLSKASFNIGYASGAKEVLRTLDCCDYRKLFRLTSIW